MRITRIGRAIKTWSDKFTDFFFKSINRIRILNIIIEQIPLNNSGWKKECGKYSCFTLNKGMFLWFLVVRVDKTLEIILKRYEGCSFLLSVKKSTIFGFIVVILVIQDPIPGEASLLGNL